MYQNPSYGIPGSRPGFPGSPGLPGFPGSPRASTPSSAGATRHKPETATYRVLHSPSVVVRDKPGGRQVGTKNCGDVIRTNMRTVGGDHSGWVRLQESFNGKEGWMMIHGERLGLGTLLQPVTAEQQRSVIRYRVLQQPHAIVRDKPNGDQVGKRMFGRVIRTDLEAGGWVRVQADFFKVGKKDIVEGWLQKDGGYGLGRILERHQAMLPSLMIGILGSSDTTRYWVINPGSTVVRDRPWGRVIGRKSHGALLRVDASKDGWVRLEEDFLEDGDGSQVTASAMGYEVDVDDDDEDGEGEQQVLQGWVLLDGRDLGLNRQLIAYEGEGSAPKQPPPASPAAQLLKEANRRKAEAAEGLDFSIKTIVKEASLPQELGANLEEEGVLDIHDLIRVVSLGDFHEELKALGVTKLGQRAKLATIVQPYQQALGHKDAGNALYKDSRFDEAIGSYNKAITSMQCHSTDLALNCYSNRAACYQQMREPELALSDTVHVLKYDPQNEKALKRKQVYEQYMKGSS